MNFWQSRRRQRWTGAFLSPRRLRRLSEPDLKYLHFRSGMRWPDLCKLLTKAAVVIFKRCVNFMLLFEAASRKGFRICFSCWWAGV